MKNKLGFNETEEEFLARMRSWRQPNGEPEEVTEYFNEQRDRDLKIAHIEAMTGRVDLVAVKNATHKKRKPTLSQYDGDEPYDP